MENFPLFYIFSSLIIFWSIKLSLAADTITPSTLIPDGEKLVSPSQRFELGFFSPGKSKYRYLGIWYKKSPDNVLWVANRISPIFDQNAVLTVSNKGNIVLLNNTNGTIWSSKVSRKAENPVAQLLDTGNLVVMENFRRNSSESYLWQSFDYPSDTLLPEMKVGWDLKTNLERYLTSWRSADDPSPGNFTYRLDIHVLPQISLYDGSVKLSRIGDFSVAAPSYSNFLYDIILVDNKGEIYYWYESYNNLSITMLKLNSSGKVQRLIWNERSNGWDAVFTAPGDFCETYGICGANSICSVHKSPNCECLKGFKLKSQDNQTCVRSHLSDCRSGDRFMKFDDVKLPDLLEVSLNESMNLKECESECLNNCTCRGYANSKIAGGGSGCLMWFGDLIDIRETPVNFSGQSIYIRVPASEPGKKKLPWIVVIVVIPMLLLSLYILRRWRRKHKEKDTMKIERNQDLFLFDVNMSITTRSNELCEGNGDAKDQSKESWLPLFSLASVAAATKNFSMQSKLGEGGFGPVYKGRLLNGQEVAVKKLSSQSGQGLREFRNEMMLIAKLQHRNLVRLLGCCIEQGEKILIYEYMPNRSLNVFLFVVICHLEYALQGLFSIKSDVFSFGVLMLETLSSKKITSVYNTDSLNLLGHAWDIWKDDRTHELIDPTIQNEASYPILTRYINVALLCVQENAEDRPTMSEVISMIDNELFNLQSPKQPAFSKGKTMKNSSHSNKGTSGVCSVNDVTVSLINPR